MKKTNIFIFIKINIFKYLYLNNENIFDLIGVIFHHLPHHPDLHNFHK